MKTIDRDGCCSAQWHPDYGTELYQRWSTMLVVFEAVVLGWVKRQKVNWRGMELKAHDNVKYSCWNEQRWKGRKRTRRTRKEGVHTEQWTGLTWDQNNQRLWSVSSLIWISLSGGSTLESTLGRTSWWASVRGHFTCFFSYWQTLILTSLASRGRPEAWKLMSEAYSFFSPAERRIEEGPRLSAGRVREPEIGGKYHDMNLFC